MALVLSGSLLHKAQEHTQEHTQAVRVEKKEPKTDYIPNWFYVLEKGCRNYKAEKRGRKGSQQGAEGLDQRLEPRARETIEAPHCQEESVVGVRGVAPTKASGGLPCNYKRGLPRQDASGSAPEEQQAKVPFSPANQGPVYYRPQSC